jgi:transposase
VIGAILSAHISEEQQAMAEQDIGGVLVGRSNRRSWPEALKARIVRESFAAGAMVDDVARRHGVAPRQLTRWRRAARDGRLVFEKDAVPSFVPLTVEAAEPEPEPQEMVEIMVGRVGIRLGAGTSSMRIAEIAVAVAAQMEQRA